MKGIIFTEFIEMVEESMGLEMVDHIIETADLPSEGIYTAVGTYPEEEILALLTQLNQRSGIPIPDLLESFGEYLFGKFAIEYEYMFEGKNDSFAFLSEIEHYIHVEVLKLYPDALLPTIEIPEKTDQSMVLIYKSPRKLGHLAVGLMRGCSLHFGESISIKMDKVLDEGREVWFNLIRD